MELVQEINRITKLNSIGAKNPKEAVRDMSCVPLSTSADFTNFMKNSIDCPDFNIKAPELDRD
jgi:hypothetical protein